MTRCEGYVRKGGAFTLGPVTWHQCTNEAIVSITFNQNQEGKTTLPACAECWERCREAPNIEIFDVQPIDK